uniref:DNA replication complex GINS protein PSF3 n=1 Tax=Sus scrofa TaxID=9823 RepID=A0A4X1UVK7_PIG
MSEAYFRVESGALGPEENFLSLDDILMSHEKLPVRTEIPMPRLGTFFLDRSGGAETDNTIPQGSKLELPLWLAKGLFDNKRRILSVELPKIYQEGWRTVFGADANVVDLHKMGPHFYGFGSQLLHFDSPENADISQALLQASHGCENLWHCTRLGSQPRQPPDSYPGKCMVYIISLLLFQASLQLDCVCQSYMHLRVTCPALCVCVCFRATRVAYESSQARG